MRIVFKLFIYNILLKNNILYKLFKEQFKPYFRFSKQPINLFYPNSRARYLVLPLVTKKNVVVIRSVLPDCGYSYPITYLGFMACNMKTTETDDCVG